MSHVPNAYLEPQMAGHTPHIGVVGGGIAGLATAHELHRRGARVTLLERESRVGGNIRTEHIDGFLVDAGPDAFVRTKPDATQLCEQLGLSDQLITTQSRSVYVAHRGRLELMPAGMALAIPTRLGPMLKTPLLSWRGKVRALADVLIAPRDSDEDESLGHFIERRFGKETSRQLAGPLLGGIYAGDVDSLSIKATFPQLLALEKEHGSLIVGLFAAQQQRAGIELPRGSRVKLLLELYRWLKRDAIEAPSPFYSLRGGMQQLTDSIALSLPEGAIRTGSSVTSLARRGGVAPGWTLGLENGQSVEVDRVAVCLPAHAAARLVTTHGIPDLLERIPYVSTATVFVGFERSQVENSLDGVGFIVPKGEGALMAATWVSSKWEGRAPADSALLRGFIGGSRNEDQVDGSTDEELIELTLAEMRRFMGHLGQPTLARVYRYSKANPQPLVGHGARIQAVKEKLAQLPGLEMVGAAFGGVGIPDCIKQGKQAAENLLQCC